jgi:hypothetical protein
MADGWREIPAGFQGRFAVRKLASTAVGLALTLALAAGAGSALAGQGPPAGSLIEDGTLYRTHGTPTDFSGTGAPSRSYDTLYNLGGNGLINVIEAAPGDPGFNGGRWMVVPVIWTNMAPTQFTSDEQILAARDAGLIQIGAPVKFFECPVIKVPPSH